MYLRRVCVEKAEIGFKKDLIKISQIEFSSSTAPETLKTRFYL